MQEAEYLRWTCIKSAPRLTEDHKKALVHWAKSQLHKALIKSMRTIFRDEKRFCLDGPDDSSLHWTSKRLDPRYFSTRQNGGGGVLIRDCFSAAGTQKLAIIEETLDSAGYCTIV